MRKLLLLVLLLFSANILHADVGGIVFDDLNGDGTYDTSDQILSGTPVEIFDYNDILVGTTTTDASGIYIFYNIPAGNYYLNVCNANCLCASLSYTDSGMESFIVDIGLSCNIFDLALSVTLAAGQPAAFSMGDLVTFDINIYNQGTSDAYLTDVVNYIPDGLLLNDGDWFPLSTNTPNTAWTQVIGPITPGGVAVVPISLYVADDSFCSITNAAELLIVGDIDSNSDTFASNDNVVDNVINNSYNDEDDHDIESITINCINGCDPVIDSGPGIIPDGTIHARDVVISSGTVPAGAQVTLKAGDEVSLNNGFNTAADVDFTATIEPCSCDLPAPDYLIIYDVNGNDVSLSWDAVPGASNYFIAHYADENLVGNYYAPSNSLVINLTGGTEHEFIVYTSCDDVFGNDSQGPAIGYTLSDECSSCLPPQNLDVEFNSEGDLVVTWDTVENASFYTVEFLDENGDPIVDEFNSDSDNLEISPSQFPGEEFPEVFEVVLSVTCGPPGVAKRVLQSKCHALSAIVMTEDDVPGKYGPYCSNGVQFYKINCIHTSTGITINKFRDCHCSNGSPISNLCPPPGNQNCCD